MRFIRAVVEALEIIEFGLADLFELHVRCVLGATEDVRHHKRNRRLLSSLILPDLIGRVTAGGTLSL